MESAVSLLFVLVCLIFLPVAIVGAGVTSPVWGYHYYRYNKIIREWYKNLPDSERIQLDHALDGKISSRKLRRLYVKIGQAS